MTEITDLVLKEQTELLNLKIDPTVICNRKYFSLLEPSYKNVEDPKGAEVVNSLPLIFYPPTEDSNHENNIKHLSHITHRKLTPRIDYYSDDDAETNYLSTPPVSFLILGKPGIGQTEIAQLLSKEWKCVNINPENVVKEELISGTRSGKCINYNLEAGRAVEPEIILRLVEKRLKSETVQHRGTVISGFPLLQNKDYKQDPISSESAVFNVTDIFEELLEGDAFPDHPGGVTGVPGSVASHVGDKTETDIGSEEEEEAVEDEQEGKEVKGEKNVQKRKRKTKKQTHLALDFGPSDIEVVVKGEDYHDLADPRKQLKFLLNLLNRDYLVIIYLSCENIDVVSIRGQARFDIREQKEVFLGDNLEDLHTSHTLFFQEDLFQYDGNRMKRFVKLPHNFKDNVSSQLMQFRCYVLDAVNETVLNHNPEYFIKVDARLSIQKMFSNICSRLHLLSFQPVLIPEKLQSSEDFVGEGEDFSPKSEKAEMLPENNFNQLRGLHVIGSMYKHQMSNWGFKCPVALKQKRIVQGKMKLAIRFMNKIYFLSNDENLLKFYRNPRPFLLPTIPIPTGRIWILGAQVSGKSAIAKCLSLIYKWPIFNTTSLERDYMKRKKMDYIEKLRTASITEALVAINHIRQKERENSIEEWKNEALVLIREIIQFRKENISNVQKNEEDEEVKEIFEEEAELESKLKKQNLPFALDSNILNSINTHHDILMKHLPEEFTQPIEPATVFDEFVSNFVENVLRTTDMPDMDMTFEEKIDMFKTAVEKAEHNSEENNKGGWIIDGMTTDLEIIKQLCPEYLADDIICIKDTDPEHIYMKNNYAAKNYNVVHYKTFFESVKKKSISNVGSLMSIDSEAHFRIIESILSDIQNQVASVDITEEMEIKLQNYCDSITEFNAKWDEIKEYLNSAYNSTAIEINPENKDMYELLKEALINFENRYKKTAHAMTGEERDEEVSDFTEALPLMDEEYGEVEPVGNELFKENRRLGDTNIYCPVAFDRHFVLWKGKEELSVLFEQNVYLLSSVSVMEEFVTNPTLFLSQKPINKIPPMRICITGVLGSGKTTAAKNIAQNCGLHYVNYDDLLLSALNLPCSGNIDHVITADPSLTDDYIIYADSVNILKEYLDNNQTLGNDLVKKVLYPLWFREPYLSSGFILDNFPRRSSDIEIMTQNYFIPDMVIELFVTQEHVHSRLFSQMFENALIEVDKLKQKMELRNKSIFNKWQEDRYLRLVELKKEKRILKYQRPLREIPSNKKLTTPVDSKLDLEDIEELEEPPYEDYYESDDEYEEPEDLTEINEILDQELPPPVFDVKVSTEQEITQKIESQLDTGFARDMNLFDSLRIMLQEVNIENIVAATSDKSLDVVLFELLINIDKFKYRSQSLFERVYETHMHTAEKLLESGYYFVSKFGRTCPVQVYNNINPINMFSPSKLKDTLFPLIHRRYIYFVHTEESRDKFKRDPLKYTFFNNNTFPLIPARIAIIGPPKSGKSILAERINKEFRLKIITRGTAIRYIQNQLSKFETAKHIEKVLRKGWSVTYEMVAKSVEALTMDSVSMTQGYVLDGFPNSEEEMKYFIALGIVPHVILDLNVNLDDIKNYSVKDVGRNPLPTYSFEFIKCLYKTWKKDAPTFRAWLHKTYQNVHSIDNKHCEWLLGTIAREIILSNVKKFQDYLREKEYDQVLNVTAVCVTPSEINNHQSMYKNYCPFCLVFDNILEQSISYSDRNSIVRYLEYYYYICPKHIPAVYEMPAVLIPPPNAPALPENIPELSSDLADINDASQNGLCVVCFWDNQPKRVLQKGDLQYSVKYMKLYAFCSETCQKKFMQLPKEYYNKVINFRESHPLQLVDFKKLPTLGYLEQFTQKLITAAVVNTEILRPYHPCTTIAQSAALHMALFLKINNPKTPKEFVRFHYESKEKFDKRREKLKSHIEYFKSRLNPNVCITAYQNVEQSRYKTSDSLSSGSGDGIEPDSAPTTDLDLTYLFEYFAKIYDYFGEDYDA